MSPIAVRLAARPLRDQTIHVVARESEAHRRLPTSDAFVVVI